jgi:hypothetical protein
VDPGQPASHPRAGLVEVRRRPGGQLLAHELDEPLQPPSSLGHHPDERAGRHARAAHLRKQLRGPVDGQVLVDQQVAHQRPHPRPVAGRRAGLGGEGGGGHPPTGAAAPLRTVLHDAQAQHRQVKHQSGLDPNHHRAGQIPPAPTAPLGHMLHDPIRLGDLGQMGTRGAGLLARLTAPRSPLSNAPLRPRGPAKPVRRRWFGGIGGVLAQATLQLGDPGFEGGIGRHQPGVGHA